MNELVVFDAGHGGSDPGAVGNGLRESDVVLEILKLTAPELTRHGLRVEFTRTTDKTLSLSARANYANNKGAALFVSDHCNSATASARGAEVFGHPTANAKTDKLCADLSKALATKLGIPNRGAKEANFAVLRLTNMPAILIENAFISNSADASLLKNKKKEIADVIASQILKYFGISCNGHDAPKPEKPSVDAVTYYRVICGSFNSKASALEREAALEKLTLSDGTKVNAFLDAFQKDGKTWYRVVAGSFSVRANADDLLNMIEKKGYDCFITVYEKATSPSTSTAKPPAKPKEYLNLKPSVTSWNVYPLSKSPVVGNECGKLAPSKFGGLSYEILNKPQKDVYSIRTSSFGTVNIYAVKGGNSTISAKPMY